MNHEKIIKRANGTQYRLRISVYTDFGRDHLRWDVECWAREPKKKNWSPLPDTIGDHQFRGLSMANRENHTYQNILRFVTEEEILTAKLELWQKIKPS